MKPPKYVSFNGVALILDGENYHRPAGQWDIQYKIEGDKIISVSHHKDMSVIELLPISEKEFKRDNRGYV